MVNSSADLISLFNQVRIKTLELVAPLKTEDYVIQPMADISPPKWHIAHTTWFFENFILYRFKKGYKVFHPQYNFIFNSYYESVGKRALRVERGYFTRPTVDEIRKYRAYVDENMNEAFQTIKDEDKNEFYRFLEIGIQHEQQHQELLLTDIKYILGNNPLFPQYKPPTKTEVIPAVIPAKFLPIEGGVYEIGYEGSEFCWDNEKPVHKVLLNDFSIMNRLVTNSEYIEFMEAGGYKDFRHWLGEGWDLMQQMEWEAPLYWHKIDNEWHNYTLNGLSKVNMNEPVTHISFYETDAYATWAGKRLLTEFEWEAASHKFEPKTQNANFVETGKLHPSAIQNSGGINTCQQLLGDAWEWTYSSYFPYPGYRREVGALGEYNGKFMINQMVLRGGSCATPESHIRTTYRNFFHADKRWQFSGIRLAQSS
jgi:ergothioneine biosynthesis protein EgtB